FVAKACAPCPSATELVPDAVAPWPPPTAVEPSPEACAACPKAKEPLPDAVEPWPNAEASVPVAIALYPTAVEQSPEATLDPSGEIARAQVGPPGTSRGRGARPGGRRPSGRSTLGTLRRTPVTGGGAS